MTLIAAKGAPTLEDARRAARVLAEAFDPGEVLLFGSVAQGTQGPNSDLDLVLVFDDLGDYSERRALTERAKQTVMEASGFYCDVRVTDRPEWKIRTQHCRSTFEAHIASHAVTLFSRPPQRAVVWNKEIGLASSDGEQASRSLSNTMHSLTQLLNAIEPSHGESEALDFGDTYEAGIFKRSRLLGVCQHSHMVMETSLKALIHALEGDHPGKVHDIGLLLDATSEHLPQDATDRLAATLGSVSPKEASVWRVTSTYPDDYGIPGNPDDATDEFSIKMAKAATDMASTCILLIEHQLGHMPACAPQLLKRIKQIQRKVHDSDS